MSSMLKYRGSRGCPQRAQCRWTKQLLRQQNSLFPSLSPTTQRSRVSLLSVFSLDHHLTYSTDAVEKVKLQEAKARSTERERDIKRRLNERIVVARRVRDSIADDRGCWLQEAVIDLLRATSGAIVDGSLPAPPARPSRHARRRPSARWDLARPLGCSLQKPQVWQGFVAISSRYLNLTGSLSQPPPSRLRTP